MIELPRRDAGPASGAAHLRARSRAAATAIADDEAMPLRRFQVEDGVELRGTARHRRGGVGPPTPPPRGHPRRVAAAAVLAAELGLLIVLLAAPAFHVRSVSVTGTRLLSPSQVAAAAGVDGAGIFGVDAGAIAARVGTLPWVRSVRVSVALPADVSIAVTERSPIVRVVRGTAEYAVAADGASLRLTASQASELSAVPLIVDLRPARIRSPVSPELITLLGQAAARFPRVLGVHVVAYEWDAQGQLSIWTSAGWQAILGDVSGPAAVARVPAQLAALTTLRTDLDLTAPAHPANGPSFGYVNLVDPSAPAVGGSPGLPAAVSAALRTAASGGSSPRGAPASTPVSPAASVPAGPTPTASATATPQPTPTPAPTPAQLQIPAA